MAVITGWWWLLGLLALQLAVGLTLGRRYCLPCVAYFALVQPRLGEGALEDARPPRFANTVGLAVLTGATIAYAAGLAPLGTALGLLVAALALLAAATGFCAGCEAYKLGCLLRGRAVRLVPAPAPAEVGSPEAQPGLSRVELQVPQVPASLHTANDSDGHAEQCRDRARIGRRHDGCTAGRKLRRRRSIRSRWRRLRVSRTMVGARRRGGADRPEPAAAAWPAAPESAGAWSVCPDRAWVPPSLVGQNRVGCGCRGGTGRLPHRKASASRATAMPIDAPTRGGVQVDSCAS